MPVTNLNKALKELSIKVKKNKTRYGPFYLTKANVESLQKHCRDREIAMSELVDDLIQLYLESVKKDDKEVG